MKKKNCNTNCDKTQQIKLWQLKKLKLWQYSKTQIVTKLWTGLENTQIKAAFFFLELLLNSSNSDRGDSSSSDSSNSDIFN